MQTTFKATIEAHNTNAREVFFSDWLFTATDNLHVFKTTVKDEQGTRSVADRKFIDYIAERYGLKSGKDYTIIA